MASAGAGDGKMTRGARGGVRRGRSGRTEPSEEAMLASTLSPDGVPAVVPDSVLAATVWRVLYKHEKPASRCFRRTVL